MLARGALCRLAAEVPKQATHDLPKLATLVQTARSGFSLPIRTLVHVSQLQTRSYATTQASKDPAAPVKKAVKAKAAAGKKVTKTTTTKKVAAKPKKAKKKSAVSKKAAAPKKSVKKPKKALTDEEKLKAKLSQLRKTALKEPVSRQRLTAFHVYVSDNFKGENGRAAFGDVARSFKEITPAEREKFNHLAAERSEARLAEYNAWVKSHTPEQIRLANNARKLLKKKLTGNGKRSPAHTTHIIDDRHVKHPISAWSFFFAERQKSPDFQGIGVPERSRLISAEWKALSASEKQRFQDQGEAERQRYAREKSV